MKKILFLGICLVFAACASKQQPNVPEADTVTVSREEAASDCREIGKVTGVVSSVKGTAAEAIEDMKKDAALRGANYVQILSHSATGTSSSGIAYQCP